VRKPPPAAVAARREFTDARVALFVQLDEMDYRVHVATPMIETTEEARGFRDSEFLRELSFLKLNADVLTQIIVVAHAQARPSTSTLPPVGAVKPSRISTVVVLPAPFGPSSPKHSPRAPRGRDH